MVFSSIEFMFRFLPVFLILYFAATPKYRNIILLIGSLIFYGVGEPSYIILMIISILVNHFAAVNIFTAWKREDDSNTSTQTTRKAWLIVAMVFNFGMLFVFKYLNFFIGMINGIAHATVLKPVALTLPLGISFYTFQAASYVIDIYRRKYELADGLLDFATYLCMFPQLIAGPIVSFAEVKDDLHKLRKVNLAKIEWGTAIFVLGLAYKVLLANKIASLWNTIMTAGVMGIHPLTAWLGSWGFSMQLFFDFFGYSLMAIGLGRILGFKFPMNFKNPYCATSSTDFWRRWHITLGRWFREYVYIPLGGNRKGQKRMIFNMFVVWLLTGLWHGADWNFIIWGMFFFVLLMIEKLFLLDKLEKHKLIAHIYMLIVIPVSWTIFNISDLPTLGNYLKRMFFLPVKGSVKVDTFPKFLELFGTYWWLFAICAVCCTPIPIKLLKRFYNTWVCKVILLALFWLSVYQIASGANNPFLYFRF